LRHATGNEVEIPWRRAVAEAWRQPAKLSSNPQLRLGRPTPAPPELNHVEPPNLRIVLTPIHKENPDHQDLRG
jgi:hypothetical protein